MKETFEKGGYLECPHGCGCAMADLWDYDWTNEEIITECPDCLKPITMHRRITCTYSATADEVSP